MGGFIPPSFFEVIPMTTEEIFNKLATHMCEGVAIHDELAKVFDFIGLWGFSKCHIYHSVEEKAGFSKLSHYYATHYFKLLQLDIIEKPKFIPETWYKYSTQAVDNNTKKNTVKDLITKWVEWERSTKKFYQSMRQELTSLGELAAAIKLDSYIVDVDSELHDAEKLLIKLETWGYDMIEITNYQSFLSKKYKKKLGW